MVSYSSFVVSKDQSVDCSICIQPLANQETVAHAQMHPKHKECLVKWVEVSPRCPDCRAIIDVASLGLQKSIRGQELPREILLAHGFALISLTALFLLKSNPSIFNSSSIAVLSFSIACCTKWIFKTSDANLLVEQYALFISYVVSTISIISVVNSVFVLDQYS